MTIPSHVRIPSAAAALCSMLLATAPPALTARAQPESRPKLVVLIVVDQLRAQYFEDYRPLFTKGLHRLLTEGAWFRRAAYPYLNTVTCAGHSTIGTGTFPYRHGMILNQWYDRDLKSSPACTADPEATEFSYSGLKPIEGDSAKRMMRSTLAQHVRRDLKGRIVGLSLKPRSTIPLLGPEADAATWFDDRGGWMTSLALGAPSQALQQFIKAHPPSVDLRRTWTKSLGPNAYQFADDRVEERPVTGWTRTFPHPLSVPKEPADQAFYTRWQRSPFSDEYLARMAMGMIDAVPLGRGSSADFLAVSLSALDLVGHAYGPRSHEVQDLLVRLDATIGRLLDRLDSRFGRNGYIVGLSADHGVSEIPEQTGEGGRITNDDIKAILLRVLTAALGPGDHVAATHYTDHYLSPAALERLQKDESVRAAVLEALRGSSGIQQAYYGPELATAEARQSADPAIRAAALSHYAGRSGDVILVPRRNWITSSSAATHGTLHDYDQRVPVIVFGRGVTPGVYDVEASPADLAPTLGAAVGIDMGDTDGRVLTEALRVKASNQ